MMATLAIDGARVNPSPIAQFKSIVEGNIDFELCPSDLPTTPSAWSPCNGCPLFDVCSDECAMNDANGYLKESY